jgi:MFS family permease
MSIDLQRADVVRLDPALRRRGLLFVGAAVGLTGATLALQMGLNANFLAETIGISGRELGLLEALRESCGITAFLFLALLAGFAEPLVGAAMLVLLGLGLGSYSLAGSFAAIAGLSLVWSQGLHTWMPLPNSMTLALAEPEQRGQRLGQIGAAGSVGFAAGLVAGLALSLLGVAIRSLYMISGVAALLAATVCLGVPRNIKTPGPRLVVRKRYGIYYVLCLLEGWRKQITISFAPFLLVKVHGTPVETMLLLSLIVQVVNYMAAPRVGRLIDRIGERQILIVYFASLAVFFVGYALLPWRPALFALFVVDNAFFVLAMAITTYVSRIAPIEEHTPTLSMGVAMNHVAAVAMPLLGASLWGMGPVWVFLSGAIAAAASVLVVLRVPGRQPASADS